MFKDDGQGATSYQCQNCGQAMKTKNEVCERLQEIRRDYPPLENRGGFGQDIVFLLRAFDFQRAQREKAEENLKAFLPVLVWVVCPHCDSLEFNSASAEHNCSQCGELIAFPSLWRQTTAGASPCPAFYAAEAATRAAGLQEEVKRLREAIQCCLEYFLLESVQRRLNMDDEAVLSDLAKAALEPAGGDKEECCG